MASVGDMPDLPRNKMSIRSSHAQAGTNNRHFAPKKSDIDGKNGIFLKENFAILTT